MSITLPPETQKLLEGLLQGGKYASAEAAIHVALAHLTADEQDRAAALADLKAKLQLGVDQAARGELVGFDAVWKGIDALKRQRAGNSL